MPGTSQDQMDRDQKYKITDAPDRPEEQEESGLPIIYDKIKLGEDDKIRLSKEIMTELEVINEQYQAEGLLNKFSSLDAQYEGDLLENPDQLFNLHKPTTKVKVDAIVRYLMRAYFGGNIIYSVSPHPEFEDNNGQDICDKQQDYLDYKIKDGGIIFKVPMNKVFRHSVLKYGGILKLEFKIESQKRKRYETYEGEPIYTVEKLNAKTGEPYEEELTEKQYEKAIQAGNVPSVVKIENKGLDQFLEIYPDAREEYAGYVTKLEKGKTINILVEYDEIVYNDPHFKNVLPKNFKVRTTTEGYDGLKTTRLIVERQSYTWWELKKNEKEGKFYDIDDLKYEYDKRTSKKGGKTVRLSSGTRLEKKNFENETYDVLECVYYFKLKEEDEDEIRVVCWIEEDSERVIGDIYYPFYTLDSYYFPFFASTKWPGFWQPGEGKYLTDINMAEDAILNFTLEGSYISNLITPITKDSEVIAQFLEKSFVHGMPIESEPNQIDFLQRHMKPMDIGGLVAIMNILTKMADDTTGVSSLVTGRESEIDPNAPGNKTIALLRQSGINIEEVIENMQEMFNIVGRSILEVTHQMSLEGKKYRPRPEKVVGSNPFDEITRSDMIARTNINTRAMTFAVDELNAKREDVALYTMLRQEPLIARNPQAVYVLLKSIIKNWSPRWRNEVEQLLPTLDEFKQEQLEVANKAIKGYINQKIQQSQVMGQPLEFNPMDIIAPMNEAMASIATSPDEKAVKAREKKEKERGGK